MIQFLQSFSLAYCTVLKREPRTNCRSLWSLARRLITKYGKPVSLSILHISCSAVINTTRLLLILGQENHCLAAFRRDGLTSSCNRSTKKPHWQTNSASCHSCENKHQSKTTPSCELHRLVSIFHAYGQRRLLQEAQISGFNHQAILDHDLLQAIRTSMQHNMPEELQLLMNDARFGQKGIWTMGPSNLDSNGMSVWHCAARYGSCDAPRSLLYLLQPN